MKKRFIPFLLCLAAVSYCLPVSAQTDSAWLDLGSTRVQRRFTQHISIKGEDLEKMPFSNLSEAINVWLYGIYSNNSTLVYIVDGNIIADINAYSIYDIKEIVFVQSALLQTTGNSGQQQLVLVTTRGRSAAKPGALPSSAPFSWQAAGQTALVNRDYAHVAGANGNGSASNFYHQYYISGSYTHGNIQAGVSADWMRDVFPVQKNDTTHILTPFQINRYRFNGFVEAGIGRHSQLYITVAAAPGQAPLAYSTPSAASHFKENQFIVTPHLQFSTHWGAGWHNVFSASYQSFDTHSNSLTVTQSPSGPVASEYLGTDKGYARAWALRDHLSLTRRVHNWTIVPALNVQYLYEKLSDFQTNQNTVPFSGGLGGIATSYSTYATGAKGHLFNATPSIDFSYKDVLSLGAGGFAYLPQPGATHMPAAIFPFGHVSLDVLKLGKVATKNSLLLFGSVARNYGYTVAAGQLDDFTQLYIVSVNGVPYSQPVSFGTVGGTPLTTLPGNGDNNLYAAHTIWSTGATLRLANDKLLVNYNYEKRDFTSSQVLGLVSGIGGAYYYYYPKVVSQTHHIGLSTRVGPGDAWLWQPGITLTNTRLKTDSIPYAVIELPGDFSPYSSWTGGWVNRFSIRRFFAGVDILYHLSTYYDYSHGSTAANHYTKTNSVDLQHIYAGYNAHLLKRYDVELYVDSRNLAQNSASDLTDRRRYYGAGFKTSF